MPHERKFLSLIERVKVIEINDKNRSTCKIVEDFGVRKTQVQNILKREAEVLEEHENDISGARKRLCRTSDIDMMNEQCLNWFQDATKRCTVQIFNSCTSRPDVFHCLVVKTPMANTSKIQAKHINDPRSLRAKATFNCEVIHASMLRKFGGNRVSGRVLCPDSPLIKCRN